MALPRTDTLGIHDLVVPVMMDEISSANLDRLIPCPFNGYVERVALSSGGTVTTTDFDLTVRLRRDGVEIANAVVTFSTAESAFDAIQSEFGQEDLRFQAGDVLDLDPSAGGGASLFPITATVVLKRL